MTAASWLYYTFFMDIVNILGGIELESAAVQLA